MYIDSLTLAGVAVASAYLLLPFLLREEMWTVVDTAQRSDASPNITPVSQTPEPCLDL
jgi:hypothetical protein